MELTPEQFYRLTVAEFDGMLAGFNKREERRQRQLATFVATIVNTCSMNLKESVTVDQILGKSPAKAAQDYEQLRRRAEERRRERLRARGLDAS